MKLFVALVAASAAASKQFVSTLSAEERSVLRAELAAWRKEFEPAAAAQGVLPQAMMSMSPHDAEDDALQRFYDNKLAIEEARRNNPEATFDYNNPFALMTQAEFNKFVEGMSLQESRSAFRSLPEADLNVSSVKAASVDWTTNKCVNPVIGSQGLCNTGYVFAAVGAAEMAHCLVTGKRLDLSEQQVTSCSTEYGTAGCYGGLPQGAMTYLSKDGLCLESDYPYVSGLIGLTGTCQSHSCTKQKLSIGATVYTWSEEALDTALNTQPVAVSVEAGNIDWKNYREGVITHCPGSSSDHAVVAVGYDEKSYKLRNSWGDTWGERGYIRLQRGVGGRGMCNVAENIVYPKINRTPAPPRPAQCGSCTGCFYPFTRECLSHGKDYCDSNSASYGMIWCGAKPSSITATESTATMPTGTPYPTTTKASRTTTEPKLSA
ncbi:hypothetical protein H310_13513 [Aphanomyces invadans]|uniref:Peptidase C1A papain C-terminal domain-containing protein n=1 Tax=Aphanomyces invadans TaxID=157072 RepID=A0A024T8Y5_9STRA|nr:hypothetical protein H310_13513 [Aphanomyces invadans]XP_008881276.1 hypothetical protein H310_15076 [Aphanomyces invadans]ETV90091.1 hypothetical protein H310_15076 [Aphanomyces invadans]ETV92103.1 hypothetical protein H310_13513 [Aphanomyces invadans]|eukprot:XP_008879265.1 hypothetical protein H310_13513 [Aphanomyces invadans]